MAPQLIPLPQNFDGQTRLFPLTDLVFFPSTVLPLHIFESRYCEMMEDALQGDQLISMATLATRIRARLPLPSTNRSRRVYRANSQLSEDGRRNV